MRSQFQNVVMSRFHEALEICKANEREAFNQQEAVFSALSEYGESLKLFAISALVGMERDHVKQALGKLVSSGRVSASGLSGLLDYSAN